MTTISQTGLTTLGSTTAQRSVDPPGTLGKNGFLKVLAAQLSNQDPMSGGSGTDTMQQMTQLGILEQLQNLALGQEKGAAADDVARNVALIGKTVTYRKPDGTTVTGVVEKVGLFEGRLAMTIGGEQGIDPGSLTEVS